MPFIPTNQPDDSIGVRYSKAFKYVFAMLRPNDSVTDVDPSEGVAGGAATLENEGRFVVLTLPQQIQFREPYATVVTVMQDGGKVIETKGQVLRMASISGTTGFLPPTAVSKQVAQAIAPTPGKLIPNLDGLDNALGQMSGYLAFQKLRYLFRQYGEARRAGDLTVQLHFFDYKNDDFWLIEPESFDMARSNRKPMSYDYNIAFKCIEYSNSVVSPDRNTDDNIDGIPGLPAVAHVNTKNLGGSLAKVAGGISAASKQPIQGALDRFTDMVESGLGFLQHCDAVVQRAFFDAITKLDTILGVLQDVNDTFFSLLDLVPTLLAQLSVQLDTLFNTLNEFAPDNIAHELNEWGLEVTRLSDHLAVQVGLLAASQPQRDVKETDQRFSQGRGKQGSTTDLMQEPSTGAGSPDANPFIGASGLQLVTDVDGLQNSTQYTSVIINNGEDIYALARRVFGKVERFIDLVLMNRLEFPFIISNLVPKPPNTLAWGDSILVPVTPTTVTNTTISDTKDTSSIPTTSGVVTTAGSLSQLIDNTQAWQPDQWIGYSVIATTGGSQQTLICSGNTDIQLTLNGNWTITITPGVTTYVIAYSVFNPRRPLTPDTRAYGQDLLVVFATDGRGDIVIAASADLAIAAGLDNFEQAITLRARCPLGEHPFHKTYGLPAPVGRPNNATVGVLHIFFIKRSLMADPRVGKVRNVQLTQNGDTMQLYAEIQPIDARQGRPITVQVGS